MGFIVHGGSGLTIFVDFITHYSSTFLYYGFEVLEVEAMICVFERGQC